MTSRHANPLKSILHPYIFVLKEGGGIKNDFLDYSLMMLFIHSRETIPSPVNDDFLLDKVKKKPTTRNAKTIPSLLTPQK